MKLEMTGVVEAYGERKGMSYFVDISGKSLHDEIERVFGLDYEGDLVVCLAHGGDESLYSGEISIYRGFTGTDVTPGDPPEITVGGVDLFAKFYELDGQIVHVRIDDGRK